MRLIENWRAVLRHAWSIRLLVLAGVLSGLEAALPFANDLFDIQPGVLALLTLIVVAAALVARLVAQTSLGGRP